MARIASVKSDSCHRGPGGKEEEENDDELCFRASENTRCTYRHTLAKRERKNSRNSDGQLYITIQA